MPGVLAKARTYAWSEYCLPSGDIAFAIYGVPIFAPAGDGDREDLEGMDFGLNWMTKAVQKYQERNKSNYWCPIHLEHQDPENQTENKPFAGFPDNIRVGDWILEGKTTPAIIADLVDIPAPVFQAMQRGEWKYASIEIRAPYDEISSLALLNSVPPHHKFGIINLEAKNSVARFCHGVGIKLTRTAAEPSVIQFSEARATCFAESVGSQVSAASHMRPGIGKTKDKKEFGCKGVKHMEDDKKKDKGQPPFPFADEEPDFEDEDDDDNDEELEQFQDGDGETREGHHQVTRGGKTFWRKNKEAGQAGSIARHKKSRMSDYVKAEKQKKKEKAWARGGSASWQEGGDDEDEETVQMEDDDGEDDDDPEQFRQYEGEVKSKPDDKARDEGGKFARTESRGSKAGTGGVASRDPGQERHESRKKAEMAKESMKGREARSEAISAEFAKKKAARIKAEGYRGYQGAGKAKTFQNPDDDENDPLIEVNTGGGDDEEVIEPEDEMEPEGDIIEGEEGGLEEPLPGEDPMAADPMANPLAPPAPTQDPETKLLITGLLARVDQIAQAVGVTSAAPAVPTASTQATEMPAEAAGGPPQPQQLPNTVNPVATLQEDNMADVKRFQALEAKVEEMETKQEEQALESRWRDEVNRGVIQLAQEGRPIDVDVQTERIITFARESNKPNDTVKRLLQELKEQNPPTQDLHRAFAFAQTNPALNTIPAPLQFIHKVGGASTLAYQHASESFARYMKRSPKSQTSVAGAELDIRKSLTTRGLITEAEDGSITITEKGQ